MLILPTRTDGEARYTFECDLDEVTFQFSFEWNDRDSGWYMSISDVNGSPIISGRRVVLNYPLTNIYADARKPKGELIAIDTTDKNVEPGLLDLGDRVLLMYMTAAEKAAL